MTSNSRVRQNARNSVIQTAAFGSSAARPCRCRRRRQRRSSFGQTHLRGGSRMPKLDAKKQLPKQRRQTQGWSSLVRVLLSQGAHKIRPTAPEVHDCPKPSGALHAASSARKRPSPAPYRLNSPIISALASVLKCKLNPTTAADVSAFTRACRTSRQTR